MTRDLRRRVSASRPKNSSRSAASNARGPTKGLAARSVMALLREVRSQLGDELLGAAPVDRDLRVGEIAGGIGARRFEGRRVRLLRIDLDGDLQAPQPAGRIQPGEEAAQ